MKISTKGRYALRMMIDLAQHAQSTEWIPLKDVSLRQDISIKYLEQIVQRLCSAGMLKSLRGPSGGYQLSKPASSYTAGEILRTIEGSLAPVACLEGAVNVCPRASYCPSIGFYEGLRDVIDNYVNGITLQELADQSRPSDTYEYFI
ncbi:MAG: Rrf2 family transcriptional regulator [Oscillospiraceae bacterium]|jgi:Rrf2 family protein|nr:Rrf2 family transcriptional regulator [Oscillospiraceae bacterium]